MAAPAGARVRGSRLDRSETTLAAIEDSIRLIGRQTARLVTLVHQLLDVTRMTGEAFQLEVGTHDVVPLARDIGSLAETQATSHTIRLEAQGPLEASIDPLRFEQVLTNLLDNAIKFSPEGGAIEIAARKIDDLVEVSVRDHGLGVDPEHRPYIFNRFYQAHAKTYRSGLGLGLAISCEIVRRHGGTLRAEFPDDGGTRFIIRVPAAQPVKATAPLPPAVLMVDDDDDIRSFVVAALEDEGYQVAEAAHGAEALDVLASRPASVILLDMRMPVMDGWEFTRTYAKQPGSHAPIIAMTAAADVLERAEEIHAQGTLGKPFDLSELYAVVESVAPGSARGDASPAS